jgi:hypothetical protein
VGRLCRGKGPPIGTRYCSPIVSLPKGSPSHDPTVEINRGTWREKL